MPLRTRLRLALIAGLFALGAHPAAAEDFFAGKTVVINVGSAAGGSYDLYARMVARHIGRFIPGAPTVIVRNMPGANSGTMATFIYDVAPKDGTQLGAPLNTVPLTQLLEPERVKFNSAEFQWLGAVSSPANVLATWHTSGVKSIEDAQKKEVLIGATTPGTTQEMYPLMANNLFGTKFKVVTGYVGGAEVNIAMERGEVQGRGANTFVAYRFQNADWLRDKKINFVFQMTAERDPEMKDVPTLLEYAKTDEQKKIVSMMVTTEMVGRSLFAPPNTPADRVALLRKALMDVVKDKEFLADMDKAQLEISPIPGEKLQQMVKDLVATPPDIVEKYKLAVAQTK
jgi:tripartite-type tricarboxylate transporter receptor subunit TctC